MKTIMNFKKQVTKIIGLFICLFLFPLFANAGATYQPLLLNDTWDKNGSITDTYDYRYYELTVPKAGYLTVDVNAFVAGLQFRLYNEDFELVDDGWDYCLWGASDSAPKHRSEARWIEAGTYYVRVYKYGDENGNFWIKAAFREAGNQETEPNQTYAQATKIAVGNGVRGLISLQDKDDYYTFTLTAPQKVTFQFKAYFPGGRIRLRNADLEIIHKLDHALWGGKEVDPTIRNDEVELEAGLYYVHIDRYSSDRGYYDLKIIPGKVTATQIILDKTSMNMKVGESGQLTVSVLPVDTENKNVSWTSSNPTVAKVNEYGVVSALKAGNVTIKATTQDGSNISASCTVTVTEPEKTLTVSTKKKSIYKGSTYVIDAVTVPAANISYSTSNRKIATVKADGTVVAKKKGNCKIYVNANGIKKEISITVKNPVLKVNKSKLTLKVRKSYQLKITSIAPKSTVTYKSSNKAIAKVTKKGKITAKKVGKCKVYVKANGITKTVNVTVKKK